MFDGLTRFKLKTNLRIYTCIVKVSKHRDTFEVDVYEDEPYFRDGTMKFLGEAFWIGGWEDEPFSYPLKPIDCAKKTVDDWERPQKLENHLRLKNHFINANEEENQAKETPPLEPLTIIDHEEKAYANHIAYLAEHPEEISRMDAQGRNELLKDNVELRLAYHEWRAMREAAR